ncbi:MAG: dihydrolipoamide acetyltransferase family protein [Conexibacter sp.]
MPEITMPRLSDSMEEGTILRWLVADGATVARGDEIAEIETDKANMTYESDASGVFRSVAAEGDALPVGAVIAHVLGDGESLGAPAAVPAGPVAGDAARVKASPVARRLARELGVDLSSLAGSGPGGRIVKADVEAAASAAPTSAPAAAPQPAAGGTGKGDVTTVELTSVQKTIARRMAESRATVPDIQIRTEADVTDLLALRAQVKAAQESAPSVNDFVVKACALALREQPRVNGAYKDGAFELYGRVNVGVAVAGEGTLIVPTIFDADVQPVTAIAQQTRALAERARNGTILPPELSGGTFTVSNLGMFGVTSFTAVVNPGQAAILAVGAAVARPAFDGDGNVVKRHLMDLSLSCDHRILYGADAARFVARVRELLQRPLALLA